MKFRITFFLLLVSIGLSSCGNTEKTLDKALSDLASNVDKNTPIAIESEGNTVSLTSCLDGCKILKDETGLISQETCRIGCYINEAEEKKDPSICEKNITDALMLAGCLTSIAEKTNNVEICDKVGKDNGDIMRGACYINIAEKTKDASLCEKIKDSLSYMGCTEAVKGNSAD